MTRVRARGEQIRTFILEHVETHPADIGKITADHFSITRQAVNKHLRKLISEHSVVKTGRTRSRSYRLTPLLEWRQAYPIAGLQEDVVWMKDALPVLGELPENVLDIWRYCFTEMINNAVDHSGGQWVYVHIVKTAVDTEMSISDDGVGI